MELSFSGCGLYILYYIGVYRALWESYGERDGILRVFRRFSGCSAGNVICGAILFNVTPDRALELYKKHYFGGGMLGFVNPTRIFKKADLICKECLPEDALDTLRKESLYIGVHLKQLTLCPPFVKDVVKREFDNNEQLLEFASGSYHVPVLTGSLRKKIQGDFYMDGITFNPQLDPIQSILVTTTNKCTFLSGVPELCIHPTVALPWHWAFFPPCDEQMINIYMLGYYDGLLFLQKNNSTIKKRAAVANHQRDKPDRQATRIKFTRVPVDINAYLTVRSSIERAVHHRMMYKWLILLVVLRFVLRKGRFGQPRWIWGKLTRFLM